MGTQAGRRVRCGLTQLMRPCKGREARVAGNGHAQAGRHPRRAGAAQGGQRAPPSAPGILAVGLLAVYQVLPQLLGHSTVAAVLALRLWQLAARAVPQEQQPALLLEDLLLASVPRTLRARNLHSRQRTRPSVSQSVSQPGAICGIDTCRTPGHTHAGAAATERRRRICL